MDKQKQIEEMAKVIFEKAFENYETSGSVEIDTEVRRKCYSAFLAYCEALYNAGYRKIPENAVVLTEEELYDKGYRKVCEPVIRNGEVVGFVNGADYVPKNLFLFGISNARKETAEKFAERLKAKGAIHTEFDWNDCLEIYVDDIDEIVKEFTEANNGI